MSQPCPLCGKTKPEGALFCEDCAKKIHTEYEVEIPEEVEREDSSFPEEVPEQEQQPDSDLVNSSMTQDDTDIENKVEEPETEEKIEEEEIEMVLENNTEEEEILVPRKKKRLTTPLLFILLTTLPVGAFFTYNSTIRKTNLDRSGWDAAVKVNSVEGYLAYMEAHPRGVHFDEAQEGLRRLKTEEAETWERMKETDNVTALRDFLNQHSGSPYAPLVKTRLDSLVWIGALQMNTAESYSDYIMLAENEGVEGDYIAEAQRRYDLLSSARSADAAALDSVRTAVNGFFIALSSLNHDGMVHYLAPTVYRFFNSGAATRERITGELLVEGALTGGGSMKFMPDLQSVQYEMTSSNHYKVNVPFYKSYPKNGTTEEIHGYIAHVELDSGFQIVSIFETKPHPDAP